MIIKLPHIDPIDTLNPPKDLEGQVKKSFGTYTECTADEFTNEDRLNFLDNLREMLHPGEPEDYVKDMIMEEVDRAISEEGNYPDKEDFYCFEFMCQCFAAGNKEFLPEFKKYEKNKKDNAKTLMVIAEIIKAVMTWAPPFTVTVPGDSEEVFLIPKPLYRGLNQKSKWVYGSYYNGKKPGCKTNATGHYIVEYPGDEKNFYEVFTKSIGMFTGMKDNNNKDLYTGDIIRIEGEDNEYRVIWAQNGIFLNSVPKDDSANYFYSLSYLNDKNFVIVGSVGFN